MGETKSLFCEVVITQDGEPIVHHLGTGRLRIDAPLAKPVTPATKPVATNTTKPMSRLEKLRLESKERATAKEDLPK